MHPATRRLRADYERFHDAQVTTGDVDPVYPVLKRVCGLLGLSARQAVEAVFVHVAYYDFGSTLRGLQHLQTGVALRDLPVTFPCGTERRNHRQPIKLAQHLHELQALIDIHGSLSNWLEGYLTGHHIADFDALARVIAGVYGNGRWASYKTVEMLWKVAGMPLRAVSMGMEGASGPLQGLALLEPAVEPWNAEATGQKLTQQLRAKGLPGATPEQVETTLCDFHALVEGRYYVGHDIDQMLAQINRARPHLDEHMWRLAMTARTETLPLSYLGELGGWEGVDADRCKEYKRTRKLVTRQWP